MIALVAAGQGVAVMPNEAQALPHPQVVFMPLHHPIYYARSTAVWRKETPTKSLDIGQCVAEMIAAQKFNELKGNPTNTIYGSITSVTQWRFLKLEEKTVTIDLTDYPLPPVDQILGILVWMVQNRELDLTSKGA